MVNRDEDRGQAHTLEALTAALLLLASIGFALQMTAVTPLSASTSSQHLENQLKGTGEGILASTTETGALKGALLYWNESEGRFHNASDSGHYTGTPPKNAFGDALQRTYEERNVGYNVYLVYRTGSGDVQRTRMVYSGQPSDHAVRATRILTLMDDDRLRDRAGNPNGTTLANASRYFAPDLDDTSGGVYNYVRVEVVAWRI